MDETTPEIWLPVVGWGGRYEVSGLGRVRSLLGPGAVPRRQPHIKAQQVNPRTGYSQVVLSRGNKGTTMAIHRLVAAAFLGPKPTGMRDIRHLDGDRLNNIAVNLAYGTHADNMQDMAGHGRGRWVGREHCDEGHELTPQTTVARSDGGRRCRICARVNSREEMRRRRERERAADPEGFLRRGREEQARLRARRRAEKEAAA